MAMEGHLVSVNKSPRSLFDLPARIYAVLFSPSLLSSSYFLKATTLTIRFRDIRIGHRNRRHIMRTREFFLFGKVESVEVLLSLYG